ncbi:MAG: DNA polymerase/3'-5' exonuclease PolX [Lentisphaerae bacterium ADurb.Bin242]|nr:MAG: DNA polymerase/3'-5' exonuclease PolX [Lentisphaerae bacterium ADurb.Bin242]
MNRIRLAVVSGVNGSSAPEQYSKYAEIFFLRLVHYLNEFVKPDAVAVSGLSAAMKKTAEHLKMPLFLGNDVTVNGILLTSGIPGTAPEKGFVHLPSGPAFRPDASTVQRLKEKHCLCCVARAIPPDRDGGIHFFRPDDFCAEPFRFAVVTLDGDSGRFEVELEQFRLPPGLTDTHVHTPLAYCSENMSMRAVLEIAELEGLEKVAFTEHSGHLYCPIKEYWGGDQSHWFESFPDSGAFQVDRTDLYFHLFHGLDEARYFKGMELDADSRGNIVIKEGVRERLDLTLGAVHVLSKSLSPEKKVEQFFLQAKNLVTGGIDILAHPFRVFSWEGTGEKPETLFDPLVRLLKENNVAAEINFHHNRPDPFFTRKCIDAGVKIALGSDSHNLYEVGFFQPHLRFLREIGYDGDLADILFRKEGKK